MKRIFTSLIGIIVSLSALCHGSGWTHVAEMYSVLPFEAAENGLAVGQNKRIQDWLKTITSDLIDNYKGVPMEEFGGRCFYDYLREEFDFHCKHRLLFHWGYNARPWSDELEAKISRLPWYSDKECTERFKNAFVIEQKRRNATANRMTEDVFGFANAGKEAAWANGMLSIVYDVHLLGDYVLDDNRDFDGVTPPSKVIGDIVNAVRRIDPAGAGPLVKRIGEVSLGTDDEHEKAAATIRVLQEMLPGFLLKADGGALRKRFIKQGFRLDAKDKHPSF